MNGIYRCEIPDTTGVDQTIYIGVYNTNTGEWYMNTFSTSPKIAFFVYLGSCLHFDVDWL